MTDTAALHIDLRTYAAHVRVGTVWLPAERMLNDPAQNEERQTPARNGLHQCGLLDGEGEA
ncbi:hypothetical protein [Kushneria phosphatilytica]|uniref:Uncharacterized protein n=1 Tax=Kushneria phosphatilytica TaxID=657387 RepID=A0A1S1NL59_9GAMM|nr:hypothetical protein [Kushneria phosphatilytica]OHV07481.1 hypothetical protein BH688_14680 [Kushneria phosphatilytica]QEL09962.1 hypothetical protein FY550_01650 [Kushneria phosphatilytica]